MRLIGSLPTLLLYFSVCLAQAEPIRIGVSDGNYDALRIENSRFRGNVAERFQCIIDRLGLAHEINLYPQVRVLHMLERGELDLGLPLIEVKDREKYAHSIGSVYDVPFFLYSRLDIDLDDDLGKYNFVIRRTGASHDLLSRRGARYEEVNDWKQALHLARMGRFDGTVIPAQIASSFSVEDFSGLNKTLFGHMQLSIYISQKSARFQMLVDTLKGIRQQCRE